MSLSFTQKLGFLTQATEFMEKNADILKAAGFNTDIRLEQQKKLNSLAVSQNEKQEAMKGDLIEQTKAVNAAMREAYVTASGNIDAMAGILKKDSTKSKMLTKIRSNIKKASKESGTEVKN